MTKRTTPAPPRSLIDRFEEAELLEYIKKVARAPFHTIATGDHRQQPAHPQHMATSPGGLAALMFANKRPGSLQRLNDDRAPLLNKAIESPRVNLVRRADSAVRPRCGGSAPYPLKGYEVGMSLDCFDDCQFT